MNNIDNLTESLPRLLVYEDTKTVFEDFRIFLSSSIEVEHIPIPDTKDYTSLIEIFGPIFFEKFDGILIDVDLYHYKLSLAQINSIGIRNGRDIAKLILEYNANLVVANYSANPSYDSYNIPYIHKDHQPFEVILKSFIELVSKCRYSVKHRLIIQDFNFELTKLDKINYLKNHLSGRNPDLYFSFYGCAWYVEYEDIIIQNGPNITSNVIELLPIEGFERTFEDEIVTEDSIFLNGIEKVPLIFWNFKDLDTLQLIFSNYYDTSYKIEGGFVAFMFNLQASKRLAQVTAHGLLPTLKLRNMVEKLGVMGMFEFQKYLLLELVALNKAEMYTSIIDNIFNYFTPTNLLKDIFLGEIEKVEINTETAWVKLKNVNNQMTIAEPFHTKILESFNIEIEIDNSFLFIIYQTTLGDFTHRIEPI